MPILTFDANRRTSPRCNDEFQIVPISDCVGSGARLVTILEGLAADEAIAPSGLERRQARYRAHAEICKVLTDPKRLMLIDLLRREARSVGQLAEEAGLSVANTSQHLAVLRHAGLVETRRAGTSIHYRLSEPELVAACDIIERIVERRLGPAGDEA